MELIRDVGTWVRLKIAGYQFPALEDVPYDSNWLVIEGHVSIEGRAWQFSDSCLLTYEVAGLAHWLERHAVGGMIGDELFFTEPNLGIRRVSPHALRVYFALESRAPWAPIEHADWEDYFVEVPIDRAMLERAALALRDGLRSFPQRTAE
jgi:hypothetical protein